MALGAFPPAPFAPSPDFTAWLDTLMGKPLPPLPLPVPEATDD